MKYACVAIAALASGCAVGAGTSTVGIWRPHRVVDTEVCVQEQPGSCAHTTEVARDIPARSFAGGLFAWFNPGYMHLSSGSARSMFALDSHYEYLRGRGGFALGARIGGNLAFGSQRLLFTMPLSLVGHWGYSQFSLYAGAGYTPYASDKIDMSTTMRHGFNVMAGGRVLLKQTRSVRVTTSVDIFQYYLQGVVATSATTAIGLHF